MKRGKDNGRADDDKRNDDYEREERNVRLRDTQEELVRLSFEAWEKDVVLIHMTSWL